MPKKGTMLSFNNFNRSMRVPFVVFADFEASPELIDTCQPNPTESYTKQYQKHTPTGFCYYIKCFDDKVYLHKPVTFTKRNDDDDVAQIFVDSLERDVKNIYNRFKLEAKMIFTDDDRQAYEKSTSCHICGNAFTDNKDPKVRDHCHINGTFRAAAHSSCNLNYKVPKFIPVIFHNLSGYDSHLFIKQLGKTDGNISCIPNNEESYISFTKQIVVDRFISKRDGQEVEVKRELRFIDSYRFMPDSLDKLAKNLQRSQFNNMAQYYDGEQLTLLLRKGVYPYDYVSNLQKLSETSLPAKEAFYSRLNDEHVSDEDYARAQTVWKVFGLRTMREYHDLYNKSDVLLLADVFENFRDVCIQHYKLDPAWYYTSPGLSWDAALKKTDVKLELLSDPDMLLMFERGTRGGISTISHRYAKSNNKYMGEKYDADLPSKYITYLDANNLYGGAMSEPLPTHGFEWMADFELDSWRQHSCILEVDLEYPDSLHDMHNEYPLAPESLEVGDVQKLIPNLNNKTKYVVHHTNLKLYESLGLKITKLYRGIRFEESPWLKSYIDLNTALRKQAKNEFEKDFFKLMNNSVFGKTMENIRKHVDIKLVNNEAAAMKLAAKPNFDRCTIFDENLVAIHMKKTKIVFNKPVYLGMCILDLSKTFMYDFHYKYIKTKYGNKATLLFTDTDSLAYAIKTSDFYKDISADVESKFDTSNYPKQHASGIPTGMNEKVPLMFKDEAGGKIIEEFVGLRAKLYSYTLFDDACNKNKKCKGIRKCVVEKSITHEDYKQCLFSRESQMRSMNVIRSHHHEVYTEEVNKIALSADDDKRVIMDDGVSTLAYGHYSLRN